MTPCKNSHCTRQASDNHAMCVHCQLITSKARDVNERVETTMSTIQLDQRKVAEFTGGHVNYYKLKIDDPKRLAPYEAECEDIIEALGMSFAEGCAFKAIWRSCAQRTLGHVKRGQDNHGIYDAEKVQYYGGRMLAERKRKAKKDVSQTEGQVEGGVAKVPVGIPKTFEQCTADIDSDGYIKGIK